MKLTITILLLTAFLSCQSPKKKDDFTFFKWNIHQSYYLKFNSSDTLYFINTYPSEEQTSFTILNEKEKKKIESTLDTLSFPTEKEFVSTVNDGETFAFDLKSIKQSKQLKIQDQKGPNQFWLLGKSLEALKNRHNFIEINKKFDLSAINKMIFSPIPIPLTCKLCPQP